MTGFETKSISENENERDSRDISSNNSCLCGSLSFKDLSNNDSIDQTHEKTNSNTCMITSRITFLLKNYLKHKKVEATKSQMNFVINYCSTIFDNGKIITNLQNRAKHELLLRKLQSTKREYSSKPDVKLKNTYNVKNKYIKTLVELEALIDDLQDCKELAVNLDYRELDIFGLSWLLQISMEDTINYFIDAVTLQNDLHILNSIFMDRKVIKVFYNAKYSVARLKTDFNLFIVNIFDLASVKDILLKSSLPDLEKELLRNNFSLIDERHTHLLSYFKSYVINLLLKLDNKNVFKLMHRQFQSLSKEDYDPPRSKENDFIYIYKKLNIHTVCIRELYVVGKFLKWRRIVGNKNKKLALNYLFSVDEIIKIAKLLLNDEDRNATHNKYKYVKYFTYENLTLNVHDIVEEARKLSNKQVEVSKYYEISQHNSILMCLDNLNEIEHNIPAVKESLKDEKVLVLKTLSEREKRNLEIKIKPQLSFTDDIDNISVFPSSRLKCKPNASLIPFDAFRGYKLNNHPYKFEVEHFLIPKKQLTEIVPVKFKSIKKTAFHFVKTLVRLQNVVKELDDFNEIAIDLKYSMKRSYLGYISLLLISTREIDYVIDAIALRSNLHILNEIFTKRSVLKVFYNSYKKIQWLQKDLSLYVVNMFDISRAAIELQKESTDLDYLMEKICEVKPLITEKYDWRERPLTQEMKYCLRLNTHYSLFIKDILSNELLKGNLLENLYNYCKGICKVTYRKPVFREDSYKSILKDDKELKYSGHFIRINVVKELNKWRNMKAQKEDESPKFILSNKDILKLAKLLPNDRQKIQQACESEISRKYISEIFNTINNARSMKNSLNNNQCDEYGFQDDEENDTYIYENEDAVMSLPMQKRLMRKKVKPKLKIINDPGNSKTKSEVDIYQYTYDDNTNKKSVKKRFIKMNAKNKSKVVRYCRNFKEGCRNDHLNAYNDIIKNKHASQKKYFKANKKNANNKIVA